MLEELEDGCHVARFRFIVFFVAQLNSNNVIVVTRVVPSIIVKAILFSAIERVELVVRVINDARDQTLCLIGAILVLLSTSWLSTPERCLK